MSRKKRRWLLFGGLAVAGIVGWNAFALQAELVVLRQMLRDPDVVYVIQGARPFTHWCLRGERFKIASSVRIDPEDDFRTLDGQRVEYLSLDGVSPAGWMRFRVSSGWTSGGLCGEGRNHFVEWTLAGWRETGSEETWIS